MAYNEELANRVRAALAHLPQVAERKMFGGVAFMVNSKMCVTVGKDQIMCRIDPAQHEEAIRNKGVQTVTMKGREYRGYVYVEGPALQSQKSFNYWIGCALGFNAQAKASRRK